jgi:hypothetical protein
MSGRAKRAVVPNSRDLTYTPTAMTTLLRTFVAAGLMTAQLSISDPLSAQTTTHTTLASFLASTQGPTYTETFTGSQGSALSYNFASLGYGYTVTASNGLSTVYRSGSIIGNNLPNLSLTFTFTTGNVTAVGGNFFVTNISDVFQSTLVSILLSDGTTQSYTPTGVGDFRGFTTNGATITSLTLAAPTGGQFYNSVDNLIVGTASANVVPEPSTYLLMGTGMLGLVGAARRRARVS